MSRQTKNLREVQEDYRERVVGMCCICNKQVKGGWYAAWEEAGTCSGKCEREKAKLPRYPNNTDEAFRARFNL